MGPQTLARVQLLITFVSCGLLGTSMFLMGHHSHISLVTDFYHISNVFPPDTFNAIAAVALLLCALWSLLGLVKPQYSRPLGMFLLLISLIPLLSLMSEHMWIDNLGGFPAIGSGQGVIKYFSLAAIGIVLIQPSWFAGSYKKWLTLFPVLLVLLWIGGMKFTELEAKGIEPLVQSSPLMAWMYSLWDLQTTSNIIGIYDLFAVALLIGAVFHQQLRLPAVLLSGAVFIVTQTFLVSWEAALSSEHFLSTGGHFLIKDLWFIANLIGFYQYSKNSGGTSESG